MKGFRTKSITEWRWKAEGGRPRKSDCHPSVTRGLPPTIPVGCGGVLNEYKEVAAQGDVQEEFFTTEYTEFHGGKKDFRIKTPWYSVPSVVIFLLLEQPLGAVLF